MPDFPTPTAIAANAEDAALDALIAGNVLERIANIEDHVSTRHTDGMTFAPYASTHPLMHTEALGDVISAAVAGTAVRGQTGELLDDLELDGNCFTYGMLEAAASTVTTSGTGTTRQTETIPQVFPSPLAEAMHVSRRMVPVGTVAVPVISGAPQAPGEVAIGTSATPSSIVDTLTALTPKRIPVYTVIGYDTRATIAGIVGDIAMTLRDSGVSGLDNQIVNGGTDGLLTHGTAPTPTTTVVDYASLLKSVFEEIDGIYAATAADLSLMLGPATYALASTLYRGDSDNRHAIRALMDDGVKVFCSAHVAAPASDDQGGLVARGMDGQTGAVQAVWDMIEINDVYTLSDAGQVKLGCTFLADHAVVRPAQYARQSYHLA